MPARPGNALSKGKGSRRMRYRLQVFQPAVKRRQKMARAATAGSMLIRSTYRCKEMFKPGVALWICHGALKGDWVIIAANAVSRLLLGVIPISKLEKCRGANGSRGMGLRDYRRR